MRAPLLAGLLAVSTPCLAYNEQVHALLARRTFAGMPGASDELRPPSREELDGFRAAFWKAAAAVDDADLRAAFLARWPTPESFDAFAFKELLQLDPAALVHGLDWLDDMPSQRLELLAQASRWPDDDERNRHRYARDPRTHGILPGPDGQPLPQDPATLDFGSLTGTTSQAQAHYGLVRGPLSDDPEVLKRDPRRFAVPKTAHATGPELAQLYTDLSELAATSGLSSADWLATAHAGAALHHLEDVCNQIHTVQVGIYEFFESAFLQSKLRDLETLGGVFGARRSLRQMGLRLIANHHLMSEDLFAKRLAEAERTGAGPPEVIAGLGAIPAGDPALVEAAAREMSAQGQPGKGLADAIVDASSLEGPGIYRLAWSFSTKTLHAAAGHEYVAGDDPDAFVSREPAAQRALTDFWTLESRGLRRAGAALRSWRSAVDGELREPAPVVRARAVRRILAFTLPALRAAEVRRASWTPPAEEHGGIAWGYPLGLVALGLAIAALARRQRTRKRPPSAAGVGAPAAP